ncbi:hypothetical protein LOAG_04884 [Loa loa]|uniref:Uncharacterized protein n=1 Tax=Loa loa TaxID=7209 RepID=A0A1S0U1Z4_LOALO|nr:hypothetical protein LOAG_04884 [Loa loa]EFO23600.1 hypothetical protein LOAG_04884 [Loa loa]
MYNYLSPSSSSSSSSLSSSSLSPLSSSSLSSSLPSSSLSSCCRFQFTFHQIDIGIMIIYKSIRTYFPLAKY